MSEPLILNGMVLSAAPSADYDRRCVLLTRERGKITAFARGARKLNSALMAASSPFAYGKFTVYEGRNAYTLVKAEISGYFQEIREDYIKACYGCYFAEVTEYFGRENLDGRDLLNLLYVSLKALSRGRPSAEMVRVVFEMKAMVLNGEYPYAVTADERISEKSRALLAYIIQAPLNRLYGIDYPEELLPEIRALQDQMNKKQFDRSFKSLEILNSMVETSSF